MSYFGMFKQIKDLKIPDLKEEAFYAGFFAGFYEQSGMVDDYDIQLYREQARQTGGPILELACGGGRVMLELAKSGFDITGVELSSDMIKQLEQKSRRISPAVRKRMEVVQGDMTKLALPKKFQLAILPATTICLLHDDEAMEEMFRGVYEHLNEGGRFVFDFNAALLEVANGIIEEGPAMIDTYEDIRGQKTVVLFQEQRNLSSMMATVNFYAEVIEFDQTQRYLGFTVKRILHEEHLRRMAERSGFRVIGESTQDLQGMHKIKHIYLEK